jgi:seryl-tRNA synthetase
MNSVEIATGLARIISELTIAVKSSNTQWMENNLDTIYKNREKQEMLELDLQEQIQKRKAEIQQDLNKLSLEYEGELEQVKMKVAQETKNYANFLKELDAMKAEIVAVFKSTTPITALLIHRHASELLNQMWNEADLDQRKVLEGRLLDVFSSVTDDVVTLKSSEDGTYYLPEKTLKLIRGK